MHHLEMPFRYGRVTGKRVVRRAPHPDTVFTDAGYHGVVQQSSQTFDESNRASAAQGDDRTISMPNRQPIVLGDPRKRLAIDGCMRLRRQTTVNVANDKIILSTGLKGHNQRLSEELTADAI